MGEKRGRPTVTDVAAVRKYAGSYDAAKGPQYVVSRSYAEVVDLISEGPIEGLTSGSYSYVRKTANLTGYDRVDFEPYTATGVEGGGSTVSSLESLGFLRSIYWNEVPVVDKDGFYNFADVNINYVNGTPAGNIPALSADLPGYGSFSSAEQMDLSITRSVGERLYGPEVKGGDNTPTSTKQAVLKSPVDKYAKTYSVLNRECTQIKVSIKVTSLMENIQAGEKTYKRSRYLLACRKASTGYGDTKARTIEYAVYYQPIFDNRFSNKTTTGVQSSKISSSSWKLAKKETIVGKVDQPYIRTTDINLDKAGLMDEDGFEGWRIRIVRTTPESLTSFLRNTSFVDSIVEVYGTKMRYPYTSMVYSLFNAKNFQRIPSRSYDCHLVKVKVPNNYNPILKSYGKSSSSGTGKTNCSTSPATGTITRWTRVSSSTSSEWDGEFKKDSNGGFVLEWTDNPAWCFYDLVTNPRYGLGEYIDSTQIDKWVLYEIAQYCDELVDDTYGGFEPRFTINYIIRSREEAFKVLNDLASVFRGIAYYTNGSIFASQDKFKEAIYQFNNSNVVDGNFTYSSSAKKARHTVAIVRYNDKRNLYQPAIEYVEDEESVRRYGIREIETTALGCTSRGQARRFAKWILASESNETETVAFTAGMEGSYLRPGDIVQVYYNNISPLKYSGRTNVVNLSKSAGSYSGPVNGNPNFDSVILDQDLKFKNGTVYQFSLLTPTYDYRANSITGSTNTPEVRRSHVQKLLFNGSDVISITGEGGTFRSDSTISGSGVCTQIYFDNGNAADWVDDPTYGGGTSANGGGSNLLDSSNYVITGYSNTGVEGGLEITYSGGCFSGENLIWSVQPNDPNDQAAIQNDFSTYKVINVKEEANNSYSIAGLLYSSGKYADVDSVNSVMGNQELSLPYFPVPSVFGSPDSVAAYKANYPRQAFTLSSSDDFQNNSNLLDVVNDHPYVSESQDDKILTLKADFSTAGYAFDERAVMGVAKTAANNSIDFSKIKEDQETITYSINVITTGNPQITENYASAGAGLGGFQRITPADNITYVVPPEYYNLISQNEVEVVTYKDNRYLNEPRTTVTFETLVNENVDHYFVIYPITAEGTVGYGLLRKHPMPDDIGNYILSPVRGKTINNLRTEGINSQSPKAINVIESEQPSFVWDVGDVNSIYNDNSTNKYEMFYNADFINYRITVREQSASNTPNIPSPKIYLELTGYSSPTDSPSFVYDSAYNNPNLINDLRSTTYSPINGGALDHKGITDNSSRGIVRYNGEELNLQNASIFYKISGSGMVIQDSSDYPIRDFDVVVEVQGQDGVTSAGNPLHANTISSDPEVFVNKANVLDVNYDIMGIGIDPPSGVFLAQTHNKDLRIGGDTLSNPFVTNYVSEDRASKNGYPYYARAAVYPNGYLQLSINPLERPNGEPTVDLEQYENMFNNAAGMVYYFTTGDNSQVNEEIETEGSDGNRVTKYTETAANRAPLFVVDVRSTLEGGQFKADSAVNIEKIKRDNSTTSDGEAFGGIVTSLPSDYATHQGGAGTIYRDYILFDDSLDLENLQIPFPKISRGDVSNVQLSFAIFDNLSLTRSFNEDSNGPKYVESNGKRCPKIFTDHSLNFSTIITDINAKYSSSDGQLTKKVKDGEFTEAEGRSVFLSESSVMSAQDSSMGFQGWANITLGATQTQNDMLWYALNRNGNGEQWWNSKYSLFKDVPLPPPVDPQTVLGEDRGIGSYSPWYELDINREEIPLAYGRGCPASTAKGIVSLDNIKVYFNNNAGMNYRRAYWGGNWRDQTLGWYPAANRSFRIKVPINGKILDPESYSVVVNYSQAGPMPMGKNMTDKYGGAVMANEVAVMKETDNFTIDIFQLGADGIDHHAKDPKLSPRYFGDGPIAINFRIIADVG